jgi:hypothetical protein
MGVLQQCKAEFDLVPIANKSDLSSLLRHHVTLHFDLETLATDPEGSCLDNSAYDV